MKGGQGGVEWVQAVLALKPGISKVILVLAHWGTCPNLQRGRNVLAGGTGYEPKTILSGMGAQNE